MNADEYSIDRNWERKADTKTRRLFSEEETERCIFKTCGRREATEYPSNTYSCLVLSYDAEVGNDTKQEEEEVEEGEKEETSSRVRGKKSLRMNLESEMTQEDCLSCCSMSTMDVTGIWRERNSNWDKEWSRNRKKKPKQTLFFSKDWIIRIWWLKRKMKEDCGFDWSRLESVLPSNQETHWEE